MTDATRNAFRRRFCVAPMMDGTDRHDRYFLRLISRHAWLYSEMVTADAVLHGDRRRLIGFDSAEHPVALQLGGSDPAKLAEAAAIGAAEGYDEINLNVGCPSDRVQDGRFGACLMAEPATVAACIAAMRAAVVVPVTVKCRIGIDDADGYDDLRRFVEPVAAAGCATFVVHARKAVLSGLSPKQNREVPPLHYEYVHRLKAEMPALEIILNGGLTDLDMAAAQLDHVDGAMLGRAAYHNPYLLVGVDARFYGDNSERPSRAEVAQAMAGYVERQLAAGVRLTTITRHLMGLYQGQPGARAWRRHLATAASRPGAGPEVITDAVELVEAARAAA
jgi:tRNA-dihydrouridine synthase A